MDNYLTSYTKINSKGIKNLNVRPKTIKLLEGNIGNKLLEICLGDDYLNLTPKIKVTILVINNWDYIKIKIIEHQIKPK